MLTDRSVSTALGYVLTLAIAALLVGGLFVAGGNFVDDRREQVIRQEMNVVGQHVASNVEEADRMVEAGGSSTEVSINQTFPDRVTGSSYRVELVEDDGGYLRINSTRPEVSVVIEVDNATALENSYAEGGEVAVIYDSGSDELVIRDV